VSELKFCVDRFSHAAVFQTDNPSTKKISGHLVQTANPTSTYQTTYTTDAESPSRAAPVSGKE